MRSILRHWLPIAVVVTALCGFVYVAVQQALRQGANDPQIQLAKDAADALERGEAVESVLPPTVDVGRSLAPFLIVYSDAGEVLGSSGLLHGQIPALPSGVLEFVREHGEDRITWQPEPRVRIATVVVRFMGQKPGFALAGRSLHEVEKREVKVELMAGAAWAATLTAALVVVALCEIVFSNKRKD